MAIDKIIKNPEVVANAGKEVAKTAKELVKPEVVENGAEKMAAAQDALGAQGAAMVKKAYVKPKTEVLKMENQGQIMAGSGAGGTGSDGKNQQADDVTGGSSGEDQPIFGPKSYNIWETDF